MSGTRQAVPEVLHKVAELALALGVRNINQLPGCWEHQIDERWWLAINGRREPTAHSHGGKPLSPFEMYVEFNSWPAGFIHPAGGTLAAGAAANEDTLIEALDAAIERARA